MALTETRNSFSSVGFLSVFPTENRLFFVGLSVRNKNRNRKIDSVLLGRFSPPVPYRDKAFKYVWKPHYNVWVHAPHATTSTQAIASTQPTSRNRIAVRIPAQHTEDQQRGSSCRTGHRALCAARLREINHVEGRRQCWVLR